METGEGFTQEQRLLMKLRDDYCGGVAAKLARAIDKDVTYVNRLFYPIGKKGRKGIGLDVMRACTAAFGLAPGFWEGADLERKAGEHLEAMTDDEHDVLDNWRNMDDADRDELAEIIAKRADRMRALRAKWEQEMGIPLGAKAAAKAKAAKVIARASVEPRQAQLPLDSGPKK
jgi:hypothetical protein